MRGGGGGAISLRESNFTGTPGVAGPTDWPGRGKQGKRAVSSVHPPPPPGTPARPGNIKRGDGGQ